MVEIFSVPAFFIVFRETLEASVILSVMLALLDKLVEDHATRKRLKKQVWLGTVSGAGLSLAAATIFLSLYYTIAKQAWKSSEALWEGILGLVAVILITVMGFSMVRMDTWRAKWERKLTKVTLDAIDRHEKFQSKRSKYALFLIPFTVVLREGVEAVIFLGGIGLEGSGTAYPIPAVVGALCGITVGYLLYKGGTHVAFKYFLLAATFVLMLIAAGVFSGCVHEFEEYTHNQHFLWKLKCCDGEGNGIWPLLGAVLGWRNSGTKGTVSAYILFWVFVAVTSVFLRRKWKREDERDAKLEAERAAAPPV